MRVDLHTSGRACTHRKRHERVESVYVPNLSLLFSDRFLPVKKKRRSVFKPYSNIATIRWHWPSSYRQASNGLYVIQRSVKNQLTADPARSVPPSDSTSTRSIRPAGRSFTPDAVAIATDSRLSNLVLTLVLGVSSGYKTQLTSSLVSLCPFYRILSRLSAL